MLVNESNQTFTNQAQLNKPILRLGNSGFAVRELQQILAERGAYFGAIHGTFNEEVEYAVILFQNWLFLREDGIVGSLTWQALYTGAPVNMPMLKRGAKGEVVMTLQQVLLVTGDFNDEINGVFGPHTDAAVRFFQKRNGLLVDGIVGKNTWYALSQVRQQTGGC
ncbi:peptidoglycan-binding protein [Coleofasciculus sp. FACHB-1120]|uniref:peptidoglycan-binding domain-containing protein n=1 Tax=Coleofasciculus sp. FACHB-1120 TaxID=2692783 RepID=UPI001689A23D|nr:peptidoglycan-binding protein [Coleofasciculus sp. FACHB-1120]MBD2741612.1 peptidoglycan-binding protein [Coleofasciculus sp. FACHB-1120]